MWPTLPPGCWVLLRRRRRGDPPPPRFSLVRLVDPGRPAAWVVKRVVGLPGEQVALSPAGLEVNGRPVAQPFSTIADIAGHGQSWRPGPGELVVLGDNRPASTDSRHYGTVPLSALTGQVVRRLGPVRRQAAAPGPDPSAPSGADPEKAD